MMIYNAQKHQSTVRKLGIRYCTTLQHRHYDYSDCLLALGPKIWSNVTLRKTSIASAQVLHSV